MMTYKISENETGRKTWSDPFTEVEFEGLFDEVAEFIQRNQVCEVDLWNKFVKQFKQFEDSKDRRWRGEYWGKMMRGASLIVGYTKDQGMYKILERTVRDMLTAQDELGRFSTYAPENEFKGWDMWCRKYVLLGMQYFLDICEDEDLKAEIIKAMRDHADYIISKVGPADEGKVEICKTSSFWKGMNSCSILEPYVRLYRLTGERSYLDFAEYIISTGFCDGENLWELAIEDKCAPYEYPVNKAYEMMSCFEGLIQYYYVTGIEKYKTAALNFGKKVLETEISIIGNSGCTHELFDHTAVNQTKIGYDFVMQETCVAVTWMKLASALLELSGDPVFADAIENTFYNAYLGALNTKRVAYTIQPDRHAPQVMPFDSYSPLTADRRGKYIGGYCSFHDTTFYGCCACIGGAGAGIIPQIAIMRDSSDIYVNFYHEGKATTFTPKGSQLTIVQNTTYPKSGNVTVKIYPSKTEEFGIALRIPAWCHKATVTVNGEQVEVTAGYTVIRRLWSSDDTIELSLDTTVERILPPAGAQNEDIFAGYRKGALILAADARITDPYEVIDIKCDGKGFANSEECFCPEVPESLVCVKLKKKNGETVRLIDYSSAGKTWDKRSVCAAWLKRK